MLYDMPGNAAEWVHNPCEGDTAPGPLTDPVGELIANPTTRVIRGGCYTAYPVVARSSNRMPSPWNHPNPGKGFRLVRTLHE
jgi:formylglycine-generating enzyme required for sulfatase activity